MTAWLSAGILFTFLAVAFILLRWGNVRNCSKSLGIAIMQAA